MGNDTVNFVLSLQDMMSGGLRKVAATAQSVFKTVENSIAKTQGGMKSAGRSIAGMNEQLERLTKKRDISVNLSEIRQANREIAALESRMNRLGSAGVNKGGGGMRMPGWMGTAAVVAGLTAGTLGIIKAGANAQQDLIGLTTFVGKQQAAKVYAQIQKDAAATPFGTKGLLSADRALISAGVAADKARVDVLGLANAIAATGGGDDELARMAMNMQQIKNAGKAEMVDIKQFGYAGINIYQLLADATGKTVKETRKMVVSYDLLAFALQKAAAEGGRYAGAMEAQSQSISGKWSTLMDNVEQAAATVGMSQGNAITGLIDKLIGLTQNLPAWAEAHKQSIASVVGGVISLVNALMSMAKWVYHNWYWLKYLAGIAVTFYAALKVATMVAGVYNTVMTLAAIRTTALAAAEIEATVATTALNTALLLNPYALATVAVIGLVAGLNSLITKTVTLDDATKKALATLQQYEDLNISNKKAMGWANVNTSGMPGIMNASSTALNVGNYPWKKRKGSPDRYYPTPAMPDNTGLFTGALEEKGSSITSGGKKQVVINLNKPMIENQIFHVGSTGEAKDVAATNNEAEWIRILSSAANAAFG